MDKLSIFLGVVLFLGFSGFGQTLLVDEVRSQVVKQLDDAWRELGKINREGKGRISKAYKTILFIT